MRKHKRKRQEYAGGNTLMFRYHHPKHGRCATYLAGWRFFKNSEDFWL